MIGRNTVIFTDIQLQITWMRFSFNIDLDSITSEKSAFVEIYRNEYSCCGPIANAGIYLNCREKSLIDRSEKSGRNPKKHK